MLHFECPHYEQSSERLATCRLGGINIAPISKAHSLCHLCKREWKCNRFPTTPTLAIINSIPLDPVVRREKDAASRKRRRKEFFAILRSDRKTGLIQLGWRYLRARLQICGQCENWSGLSCRLNCDCGRRFRVADPAEVCLAGKWPDLDAERLKEGNKE